MKHSVLILTLALSACVTAAALARAVATYQSSLTGSHAARGADNRVALYLNASGDLSGSFTAQIDASDSANVGGTWTFEVIGTLPDGSQGRAGTLRGRIGGGAVTFNDDGTVASLDSVRLAVEGGDGNFAQVGGGTGAIAGTASVRNSPQFSGTLSVNF
jgi:hypothetical protein